MEHPDYPGYLIYKDGKVYSKKRNILLKGEIHKNGYICMSMFIDGASVRCYAHRLVAQVYIPNPNQYPQVNHINGVRSDNSIRNLEWVTPQLNNLSIKQKGSPFGTIYPALNHGNLQYLHNVQIRYKRYQKFFKTEQEAKIYRLFLKYCFHIKYG